MKLRVWVVIFQGALAAVTAFSTFARGAQVGDRPSWLVPFALRLKPYALALGLAAALAIALLQVVVTWVGHYAVRRTTLQKCVDTLVGQLPGLAKHNRITVFKRVPRLKGIAIAVWRLRWNYFKAAKRRRLRRLWDTEAGGLYLVSYVRSSGARNPNSASIFRVSDRGDECEGAGQAWEEDFVIRAGLPSISLEQVGAVETWDDLMARRRNDPVRQYVARTGVRSLVQLRAFRQFARHFMGTVIVSPGMRVPWGVLLLDSERDQCPFEHGHADGLLRPTVQGRS